MRPTTRSSFSHALMQYQTAILKGNFVIYSPPIVQFLNSPSSDSSPIPRPSERTLSPRDVPFGTDVMQRPEGECHHRADEADDVVGH